MSPSLTGPVVSRRGRARAAALALLLLLVLSTLPMRADATPAQEEELGTLMTLLAQRRHGHVTYTEEHFIGRLTAPLTSEGELVYDAPAHLEKRTLRPRPETLVVDKGTITAQRGKRTYVLNLADYPQVVPLVDSIRATLAGDLPALRRLFNVQWHGSLEEWRLLLTPLDADTGRTVREIDIKGSRTRIRTVEIRQADGDRSLLTIGDELPP